MADIENPPDLRDQLAAQFDEAEKASEVPAPVVEAAPEAIETGAAAESDGHARDDKGRFAPKPPEAKHKAAVSERKTELGAKASPAETSGSVPVSPQAQAPAPTPVKAPQAWTPAARSQPVSTTSRSA